MIEIEEICIWLEIDWVETRCGVQWLITSICVTLWAKGFLDPNCNEAIIEKISIFKEIPPNFTYLQKSKF